MRPKAKWVSLWADTVGRSGGRARSARWQLWVSPPKRHRYRAPVTWLCWAPTPTAGAGIWWTTI
ncbi:unnamed protein product [Medioppia subpectinata]|uniref:Uncharacterized protein n=1 Tax=Medioppia subpectinata TaxID=1979941 RepID=A0A7R9LJ51_9ACAR|nr:unnamed protein product [Medioppia subpectinata]CAG2119246.1 unnamed protein product [Medioppia subpectinata]